MSFDGVTHSNLIFDCLIYQKEEQKLFGYYALI